MSAVAARERDCEATGAEERRTRRSRRGRKLRWHCSCRDGDSDDYEAATEN